MARSATVTVFALLPVLGALAQPAGAEWNKEQFWKTDQITPGMVGHGETVLQGVRRERFEVRVLGVLKNTRPGRDLVLARLSGIGLEKTGVIAGMSGSPVTIDGKLLGAVAYTWSFGTEPIAGITPIEEMIEYARPGQVAEKGAGRVSSLLLHGALEVPLPRMQVADRQEDTSLVGGGSDLSVGTGAAHSLVPIQTPIATSGLGPVALAALSRYLGPMGMVPVQGGGVAADVGVENTRIEPGAAMGVGLVTGDVSMTAIGTVTAVAGDRVVGFGHPFSEIGACELPLMTAYIHGVIPRQSISSKIGSAIKTAGTIDADASTAVGGCLGRSPAMVPVCLRVRSGRSDLDRTFRCQMVREPVLVAPLTLAVLTGCADLEGQAPLEMTAELDATLQLSGYPPLVLKDLFSGAEYSGSRGLLQTFLPLANLVNILSNNPYERPNVESLDCTVRFTDRRQTAQLLRARAVPAIVEAGAKLRVVATLEPYCCQKTPQRTLQEVSMELALPAGLAPGKYKAMIGNATTDLMRGVIATRPHLFQPANFRQLYDVLALQLAIRRTDLVLRVTVPTVGVALDGVEYPALPGSLVDIFARDRHPDVTPLRSSLVERRQTEWAIEGFEEVPFEVVQKKDFYEAVGSRP